MSTVRDSKIALEESLSKEIRACLPQTTGYTIEIDILENGRKKRSDASQESWRPAYGEIRIRFGDPSDAISGPEHSSQPDPHEERNATTSRRGSSEQVARAQRVELICALRSAEQRPGFEFVAIKWFRDLFLPAQGYSWSADSAERDRLIRAAVEDGILLTHKVPNPKTPAFPVTAVRLNRQHPEVLATLQDEGSDTSGFRPVAIKGEPLSSTILRERR